MLIGTASCCCVSNPRVATIGTVGTGVLAQNQTPSGYGIRVYNALTGAWIWTIDALANKAGATQYAFGLAYGLNQELWSLESNTSAGSPVYLNHWDVNGNLLSSTLLSVTFPGVAVTHTVRSNMLGDVVYNNWKSGTQQVVSTVTGILGNSTSTGGSDYKVAVDQNGNFYGIKPVDNSGAGIASIYQWDASGTLQAVIPTGLSGSLTNQVFDVDDTGTFLWVGNSVGGGPWTYNFRKLSIPGGTLLSTSSTTANTLQLTYIRVKPWDGTMLFGSGNGADARLIGGKQIALDSLSLTINGLPIATLGSFSVNGFGAAISID